MSLEGGLDSITGSLEDLVGTFDEKLTMCFQDYQEKVEKIAPVQVSLKSITYTAFRFQNLRICEIQKWI